MATHYEKKMAKVGFKLTRDKDGYPPADWEWLWASRVGSSTFKIDNIPFFAKSIAYGDIVAAEQTDQGLVFTDLVEASGHSTVRVVIYREGGSDEQLRPAVEGIMQSLKALGCDTELSHIPNLIAVDVPPSVNYGAVSGFLSKQEQGGHLSYEEACLAHAAG
jgi:hypothetical protein